MKAIIMAAGKSTRTYPLTLTKPKPLLPLLNKPIVKHQLEALKGVVDGVIMVVGYKKEMIQEALGGEYAGISIEYVEQKEQLGTGHAILQCANFVDSDFLAMNGDDLFAPQDIAKLAQSEQAALVKQVPDPSLYGIYEVADDGRVVRLVEKPKDVFSNLANIGAYRFSPNVFDVLAKTEKSERGEIEITCAIQTLADNEGFRVVESEGYWLPIGYPWNLLEANEFLMDTKMEHNIQGEVSERAEINGIVSIGRGTVVRSGVVIDGPVIIGEDCQIGPNCWLRPGATIGNRCRVGQGTEIKNSILMNKTNACHLSYIGDSVIGENVNIGCGGVTANVRHAGDNVKSMVKGELIDTGRRKLGVIIGDGVHTGIHTSFYPGRKMWPHTSTRPGGIVQKDIEE